METYRWACPDTGPAKPTDLAQWAATALPGETVYCHPRDLDALRAAIGHRAVLPEKGAPQPGTVWLARLVAVVALLVISFGSVSAAAAGSHTPPRAITVSAPVHGVYCALGCCCGSVDAYYQGHYYDAGAKGYCRWFRPLKDGQIVRATLYLGW